MSRKPTWKDVLIFFAVIGLYLLPHALFEGIFHLGNPGFFALMMVKKVYFLSVFLLPLLFLDLRKTLLFNGIHLVFYPIDFVSLFFFDNHLQAGILRTLYWSDRNEALEFAGSSWVIIAASLSIIPIYFLLVRKWSFNLSLTRRQRLFFAGAMLVFFGLSHWELNNRSEELTNDREWTVWTKLVSRPPLNFYHSLVKAVNTERELHRHSDKRHGFSFGARRVDEIEGDIPETYVLVIGEASRYANWSVNGYERRTSPYLDTLSGMISFSDYLASSNITHLSLPLMLTRATVDDQQRAFSEKSLLGALKEAGFATYWLSNQQITGETFSLLTEEADHLVDMPGYKHYDGDLLPHFEKYLEDTARKKFIVLHLIGNHMAYHHRHPEEFDVFGPNLSDSEVLPRPKNRSYFVNSYDNSILYSDYLLGQMIGRLKEEEGMKWLSFTADHGESLYDEGSEQIFHSNENFDIWQVHSPLFFWMSGEYHTAFPGKITSLERNKDRKTHADHLFYTLLDLAGVRYSVFPRYNSLADTAFTEPEVRKAVSAGQNVREF